MRELETSQLFEPATRAQWLELVAKVLKGSDFEKRLVARTADGLRIAPLYTREDALTAAEQAIPGAAPYTRGTRAADGTRGWDVRQLHVELDPEPANKVILADLGGGVSSLILQIAAPGSLGLSYEGDTIERALDGVMLEACPVHLRAGEYTFDAAGCLLALWRRRGIAESERRGGFGADPLGTLAATGALYHSVPKSLEMAARLASDSVTMEHVTALQADGRVYHNAGATEAQELAAMLATLVAYLRAMEAAGLVPDRALPKIAVTLALDADQFLGIAKLRAARKLVWRVADACGAGDAASHVRFAAETSQRMLSRRDPWVNMLRTTMACAAAAMGGADAITVLPYTWVMGRPDAFARRIARNTQLVLMEESGLGRVIDPAGGSWAVEKLTQELAERAWQIFQDIERKGGMGEALTSGSIQDEIARAAEARARLIATGGMELTGTSAFPLLGDDGVTVEPWPSAILSADLKGARVRPLRMQRLSEPFEALRDAADAFAERTGSAPRAFLASMGTLAEHGTRSTWARNFLAAGGIDVAANDGFATAEDAAAGFAQSGLAVACIAASDRQSADLGEATARALKAAGARWVLLAGRPGDLQSRLKAAGVDSFIHAGCDMLAALGELHVRLGIDPAS